METGLNVSAGCAARICTRCHVRLSSFRVEAAPHVYCECFSQAPLPFFRSQNLLRSALISEGAHLGVGGGGQAAPLAPRNRGVGRGHWAMPPWAPKEPFCDCSAPSNRKCVYRGSWRAPPTTKGPSEKPSNDDRTAPSLGKVAPS